MEVRGEGRLAGIRGGEEGQDHPHVREKRLRLSSHRNILYGK